MIKKMTPDELQFASAFASHLLHEVCPRCGSTLCREENNDGSDIVLECYECGLVFGHNLT